MVNEIESLAMVAHKNRRVPFFQQLPMTRRFFLPIKQRKQQLHRLCKLSQRKREFGYRYMSPCVQQNLQIVYNILCECENFVFGLHIKWRKEVEEKVTNGDMSNQ